MSTAGSQSTLQIRLQIRMYIKNYQQIRSQLGQSVYFGEKGLKGPPTFSKSCFLQQHQAPLLFEDQTNNLIEQLCRSMMNLKEGQLN